MYVGFTRAQHNHIKNILKDTSLVYTKDKHELFPQKPTHSLLFFILFEATCFGFMIISHPNPKFVWSSFFLSFQGFSLFWIPTMLHTRTNLSTSKPIPICTQSRASQSVAEFVFIYDREHTGEHNSIILTGERSFLHFPAFNRSQIFSIN